MTDPRQQLIAAALAMQASGLNRGTAGNISLRADEAIGERLHRGLHRGKRAPRAAWGGGR